MSKLKFEPSDFNTYPSYPLQMDVRAVCASIANARLAEMLKDCPVVYGKYEQGDFYSQKRPFPLATHKATLVNVEELPKPECVHEPELMKPTLGWVCKHCKVALKATWEAVK